MRISDWSSDVCASDLPAPPEGRARRSAAAVGMARAGRNRAQGGGVRHLGLCDKGLVAAQALAVPLQNDADRQPQLHGRPLGRDQRAAAPGRAAQPQELGTTVLRSEEHTSELQSLMRISYAVFCLTKQKQHKTDT